MSFLLFINYVFLFSPCPYLCVFIFIIKFPYNARSDWLEQRALPENRARVDDAKLAFKFLLRNFQKIEPNQTFPVTHTNAIETSYLPAVNLAHGDHC